MTSIYTPTAINSTSYTLVDDSDPPTATVFNTPIEALADALLYTQGRGPYLVAQGVTSAAGASTYTGTAGVSLGLATSATISLIAGDILDVEAETSLAYSLDNLGAASIALNVQWNGGSLTSGGIATIAAAAVQATGTPPAVLTQPASVIGQYIASGVESHSLTFHAVVAASASSINVNNAGLGYILRWRVWRLP